MSLGFGSLASHLEEKGGGGARFKKMRVRNECKGPLIKGKPSTEVGSGRELGTNT